MACYCGVIMALKLPAHAMTEAEKAEVAVLVACPVHTLINQALLLRVWFATSSFATRPEQFDSVVVCLHWKSTVSGCDGRDADCSAESPSGNQDLD